MNKIPGLTNITYIYVSMLGFLCHGKEHSPSEISVAFMLHTNPNLIYTNSYFLQLKSKLYPFLRKLYCRVYPCDPV